MDFCGPRRGALVVLALTLLWLAGARPAIAQSDPPASDEAQAASAVGVIPDRLTLGDLGLAPTAALDAATDLTLSLPLPPGGITSGRLTLHLVPSRQVDEWAMVRVSLHSDAGWLALADASVPAGELRQKGLLAVIAPPVAGDRLGLRLHLDAPPAAPGVCPPAGEQRVRLLGSSAFEYVAGAPATVSDFLRRPGGTIEVRGEWDTAAQQAASAAVTGALQFAVRDGATRVEVSSAPSGDSSSADPPALAGGGPPGRPGPRTVVVVQPGSGPQVHLAGGVLEVSGSREGIDRLLAEAGAERSRSGPQNGWGLGRTPHRLELASLRAPLAGDDRGAAQGAGTIPAHVRFTVGDLAGWPEDLALELSLDPRTGAGRVSDESQAPLFAHVRLNGVHMGAFPLPPTGSPSGTRHRVVLPAALLGAENWLQLGLVGASDAGACSSNGTGSGAALPGGPLLGTGALTWTGYGPLRGDFPELLGTLRGTGQLFLLRDDPAGGQAAARLIGALNRYAGEPVLPDLVPSERLRSRASGEYRLVIGPTSETAVDLGLPLDLSRAQDVVAAGTGRVHLRTDPQRPLVALQYLPGASPTVALQAGPAAVGGALELAVGQAVDPERLLARDGNVILADTGQSVHLDLRGPRLRAQPAEPTGWTGALWRQRWLLLLPLGGAVLLLWWGAYRRVGRPPPPPPAPPGTGNGHG